MTKNYKIIGILVLLCSCSDVKVQEVSKTEAMTISSVENYNNKTLQVYTTAKDTELRLTKTGEQRFKNKVQPLEVDVAVFVNPKKTFQEYLGVGGAITDASSEVFSKLNDVQQDKLLQAYTEKMVLGITSLERVFIVVILV